MNFQVKGPAEVDYFEENRAVEIPCFAHEQALINQMATTYRCTAAEVTRQLIDFGYRRGTETTKLYLWIPRGKHSIYMAKAKREKVSISAYMRQLLSEGLLNVAEQRNPRANRSAQS